MRDLQSFYRPQRVNPHSFGDDPKKTGLKLGWEKGKLKQRSKRAVQK